VDNKGARGEGTFFLRREVTCPFSSSKGALFTARIVNQGGGAHQEKKSALFSSPFLQEKKVIRAQKGDSVTRISQKVGGNPQRKGNGSGHS